MIILDETLLINQGTVRACYHHPHNSSLAIKVPMGCKKDREQANQIELNGYQALMREHKDLSCISHCYGIEPTNHGDGLVCDCICDSDGSVSKSILDLIHSDPPPNLPYVKKVVQELVKYILENNIHIFDLNLKNIVLQQQSDTTYKPIIIDLKGGYELKEFIPLAKYIPYFRRKKLERRCRQLLERTDRYCQKRNSEL
ncbi:MAG: hypothetical protein COA36_08680 [Desulfotalea sp.]|nr:MAG: hypothetical protein COA36_08680 [Desulfotalea sp.]